jgi:hypothetical protein
MSHRLERSRRGKRSTEVSNDVMTSAPLAANLSKTGSASLMIRCAHGERPSAVVCGHMVGARDEVLGFVENCSDPTDLQAWCDSCERVYLAEGDKTAKFLEFNQMVLVCDICYADLKTRHGVPGDS